jgi:hypothetical protein
MNGDARFNACESQQELSDEEIDKLLSAQQVRPSLWFPRDWKGWADGGCPVLHHQCQYMVCHAMIHRATCVPPRRSAFRWVGPFRSF